MKMNLHLIFIIIKLLIICNQMIVSNGIPIDHKVIANNHNIKTQFEFILKQQINELKTLLQHKTSKFDEFFRELLKTSKRDFHQMFLQTYGLLYEKHSSIFTDMFQDLEDYYNNGGLDLSEALDLFFHRLYQKMFQVLNSQYKFDDKYLNCVSKHMDELKPFGDVPKKLNQEIKRSFIATRTFVQALNNGKDVIKNILEIQTSAECSNALMKMSYCPHCQTSNELKPCANYCLNVVNTCLAFHTELDKEWNNYIDALLLLASRLETSFNIESVVDPIDIKISDAIMNFQENGGVVSNKLFESCGKPHIDAPKRETRDANFNESNKLAQPQPYVANPTSATISGLDQLIDDIKKKIKKTKSFWTRLPQSVCADKQMSLLVANDDMTCFNGSDNVHYEMDNKPESHQTSDLNIETTRHNAIINQQNLTLKLITNKLNLAYNGQDVELVDTADSDMEPDGSGSGSGSGYGAEDNDYRDPGSNNVVTDDIYFNPSTPRTPHLIDGETNDFKSRNNWSKSPKPNHPFMSKDSSFKSSLSISLVMWTLFINICVLYSTDRL
ncbi:glypican-6-like [Oppia nitens]|uniref:glypican-6-like n=1 Tax=Oppia nitens TaxID=1686743 RepID=UPI0023D9F3F4|nr:glypican-6-like [Oppia nitens]